MTALHMASQNGHTALVQLFLDQGVNTDITDVVSQYSELHLYIPPTDIRGRGIYWIYQTVYPLIKGSVSNFSNSF